MNTRTHAILVIGLGYGDEGKGKIIDFLARNQDVHTVVRFCGGAQAAHNVVTPDGKHHTFAQFGSGTFVPGVETHLSKFILVNPILLLSEAEHLYEMGLENVFQKVTVHRDALITTPFQMAANRLREIARFGARHGSCGLGIGETVQDFVDHGDEVIVAKDLLDPAMLERKLRFMQALKRHQMTPLLDSLEMNAALLRELDILESPMEIDRCLNEFRRFAKRIRIVDDAYLAERLRRPGTVIFEGSQGVLLDETYGFFPHCTRATVTFTNALTLLRDAEFDGSVTKLGVLRTYATRHGAGPFVTEDETLRPFLPELHNAWGDWQQTFRVGHLDLVATRYAMDAVGGVDAIALTYVDRIRQDIPLKYCDRYRHPDGDVTALEARSDTTLEWQAEITKRLCNATPVYRDLPSDPELFIAFLERKLNAPISIISTGNTADDTKMRSGEQQAA